MTSKALQEAIDLCEKALHPVFQPDKYQTVAQQIGTLLQSMGRFEEAVIWHTQAQATEVDWLQIHNGLGRAYIIQERWQDAISAYEAILTINPEWVEAYWKLASIYFSQNQRQQSLHYWAKALAFEPHKATPEGHVRFGDSFLKLGKMKEALNCYRRAIHVDKNYVPAYRQLAQAFLKQGRKNESIAIYREAIIRVESPGALYYDLGCIFKDQNNLDEAMKTFEEAIERDPNYPWNHHDWVQLLLDQQRWQEAIAASMATINCNPNLPWAYTQLGRAFIANGQRQDALKANRKACVLRGWSECEANGYEFSQDWFSHNIPIWQKHLNDLIGQPDLRVCEVGSFQGMSACWLLDHVLTHPAAQMHCIEPNFQPEFDANIAKTGADDKVFKHVGISDDILPSLPDQSFDLIYIDGCHLANVVQRDGQWAWEKLKSGGILIFDDYPWTDPDYPDQDPKLGIDIVLEEIKDQSTILHHDYQVIVQKKRCLKETVAETTKAVVG